MSKTAAKQRQLFATNNGRSRRYLCLPDARPSPALRSRALLNKEVVELNGIEPMTSCLQSTRSPN